MEKKENKKNSQKATWIVIGLCIVALIGTSILALLASSGLDLNLNPGGGEKDLGPPVEMQPGNSESGSPQEVPAEPEVQILEPEPLNITE